MAKGNSKKSQQTRLDPKLGAHEALELGIASVEKGNRKEAYNIFKQTTELHPNTPEAWVWLGGASPDLEAAETAFERAYTIDPENEEASLGLRWVRLRRKVSLADIIGTTVPVPDAMPDFQTQQPYAERSGMVAASSMPSTMPTGAAVSTLDIMKCPNCGRANTETEKFCVQCGQDLSQAAHTRYDASTKQAEAAQAGDGSNRRYVIIGVVVIVLVAVGLAALWWYLRATPPQ